MLLGVQAEIWGKALQVPVQRKKKKTVGEEPLPTQLKNGKLLLSFFPLHPNVKQPTLEREGCDLIQIPWCAIMTLSIYSAQATQFPQATDVYQRRYHQFTIVWILNTDMNYYMPKLARNSYQIVMSWNR